MKKKITFLISHRPDNRYEKRLTLLKDDYEIDMLYWNKAEAEINFKMDDVTSHEIHIIADQTNPLKRIKETMKFIPIAYKKLCQIHPQIVYVGNIDMLDVAYRYKKKNTDVKIIYEIADLHRLIIDKQVNPFKKIVSAYLKHDERKLIKYVDLLVLTSMKFYDEYYCKLIQRNRVVFLPNMPEARIFKAYERIDHKEFTVGFIGWIRYIDQLKMLVRASQVAKVNVLFAGTDGHGTEFKDYCSQFSNVEYFGTFDYAEKINELYGLIDCSYSVYDASMKNVRLALPNKLYESILCETPIIVAANTYLSELVEQYGVGVMVGYNDENALIKELMRLKNDHEFYTALVNNCRKHKKEMDLNKYNEYFINKIGEM